MKRHSRDNYYVLSEGILTYDRMNQPVCERPSTEAALRKFRFSRMGLKGKTLNEGLRIAIAEAMTASGRSWPQSVSDPVADRRHHLRVVADRRMPEVAMGDPVA